MDIEEVLNQRGVRWTRIGDKVYAECAKCHQMVCLNKFLFGSIHLCA